MSNLIDTFKNQYSKEMTGMGGSDLSNQRKLFQPSEITEMERRSPQSYLKDEFKLSDVFNLVKNKKLSRNKIKEGLRGMLNNPEELNDFLNSFRKDESKIENKEATSSGGGVGSYETPLFGETTKMETKEATGASSSGSYETPKMWAKSTKKKDWRGKSKTQIPGGKFVQVKEKCKHFPYCNQGDINALNIFENKTLNETIIRVSEKYGIHQDHIRDIISNQIGKFKK